MNFDFGSVLYACIWYRVMPLTLVQLTVTLPCSNSWTVTFFGPATRDLGFAASWTEGVASVATAEVLDAAGAVLARAGVDGIVSPAHTAKASAGNAVLRSRCMI